MSRYYRRDKEYMESNQKDEAVVVNIGGAVAKNIAEANNTAITSNFNDHSYQNIDIDLEATAVVNNTTIVVIGPPYGTGFTINEEKEKMNFYVQENGDVLLNGEKMDIKAMKNGTRVMFLSNKKQSDAVNKEVENNIDNNKTVEKNK
jgi:hypothetical protein